MCYYHSVLTFNYNEMGPVNELELIFCIFVMLAASFFNAHIFSDMVVLMQTLQKSDYFNQQIIDASNSVMVSLGIPDDKQDEITEYFHMTLSTREEQAEFDMFLDQISVSKKELIQNCIFMQKLVKNICISQMYSD